MDGNNWLPAAAAQIEAQAADDSAPMDAGDWRTQLQPDSRHRIVTKIMDTLKRHLPFRGQEGLQELNKIAVRFEEKIFSAASCQEALVVANLMQSRMITSQRASQSMQPQVHNQAQSLSIPLANNQSQSRQQHLLSQNIQNNLTSSGLQSSAGVPSALSSVSGITPMANGVGQISNMQSISGISQNSMGQGVPSNMFASSQMQGRQPSQQAVPQQQQQQQQSQNSQQQYLYQQQFQHHLLKQKMQQQGNMPHSLVQSHIQQQQQNVLQPTQLQSSQQSRMQTSSVMQPSMMQSDSHSGLQQNQQSSGQQSTPSVLQQHQQSVLRQQMSAGQQSMLPSQQQQQQQHLMGQQQLISQQQNSVSDMQQQHQQQQQRLLGRQNNLSNLQQHQLMAQQSNLPSLHQQQLGSQSSVSGLQQQQEQQQQQQQQLLGTQSSNPMQTNQLSGHIMQQSKVSVQQQTQQGTSTLLATQGQQSQAQQQLMSQIHTQPGHIQQQQLNMQHQPNLMQRDMQQRLQTSGVLLQTQNVLDQKKQLLQSQRAVPEASSTSLDSTAQTGNANGSDWQEEAYQKIKIMKDMYLPELRDMYQKFSAKLQQQESLPQQLKTPQLDRCKNFKTMLEQNIQLLQVSKSNITPALRDKLSSYEKQIDSFLQKNRPSRKSVDSLQQGQLTSHMQSIQQAQQTQSQTTQVQPPENQMNPQLHSMNLQSSIAPIQQNTVTNLQQGMALSGGSTGQQSMLNSLQAGLNLDSGHGNALGSLQQVAVGSLQQNPVSAPQQTNMNALTSQNGVNVLPANINPLQSSSAMFHHQHLKQQQEQQMLQPQHILQSQQMKIQQRMQQQMMQKKQVLQQQQQQQQQTSLSHQAKLQQATQLQANQMAQLQQMNEANESKMRQGMGGFKQVVFQQQHSSSQRSAYHHQQLKQSGAFPISSPQLLQAVSPQVPQHSSPQMDPQNLITSNSKVGTPLQPANSPLVAQSPSTPLAPSPMPGDSEKLNSIVSSSSNAVNNAHQQLSGPVAVVSSLAFGTPGMSASPLLAEFTNPEGNLGNVLSTVSGRSSATDRPLERLIKVVKSMSPNALSASVSDIGSVVSMTDRIAGSAPGNGSRAAVGEDLVAMTKCRLQARNIASQDGVTGTRKMSRYTTAMPLNVVSSSSSVNDSFKHLRGSETSDLESTATSNIKRPRIKANHALLEEIRAINQRLIDTVAVISDEDDSQTASSEVTADSSEGTIVKFSFTAVALGPKLKSHYASAQMSPIQPLRLLVPTNYPNCSPVLLDKFPIEASKEHEDLSMKAKSRFSISLRSLSHPMSLGEIARTWDLCVRTVISEYAQQSGGGCFGSRYGTWENCSTAA